MFAVERSVISLRARLSARKSRAIDYAVARRNDKMNPQDPHALIRDTLADLLPSTVEEIAEATGLAAAVTAECLDALCARCRVMFNPLTKRYSLPKLRTQAEIAA